MRRESVILARAKLVTEGRPRAVQRNVGTWRVRWARVGFPAVLERKFSTQLDALCWFMAELRSSAAPLTFMVLEERSESAWVGRSSARVDARARHRYWQGQLGDRRVRAA